jgi:sulfite reductase beta subunit-like hemoprotein
MESLDRVAREHGAGTADFTTMSQSQLHAVYLHSYPHLLVKLGVLREAAGRSSTRHSHQ